MPRLHHYFFHLALHPLNQLVGGLAFFVYVATRGPRCFAVGCAYVVWTVFDRHPSRGGYNLRTLERWLQNGPWWKQCAAFFPIKYVESPTLDPNRAYIFGCHPHGIIGHAPMAHFGTNATGTAERFPGLRVHLLGASAMFRIPIVREWFMLHGCGTVERRTVTGLLRAGRSVAIALGGAREALDAKAGTFRLILRRKGFVRCALETGASLVPVLSFGENELYTNYVARPGSLVRRFQSFVTTLTGSTLPLFYGLPWMPLAARSSPVFTVVGSPIDVPRLESLSETEVDKYHEQYVAAVRDLFEKHKGKHGFENLSLEVV